MLPAHLCEQLCSLNMGVDRYAFSVVWKLDQFGNILHEWFGRTVIRFVYLANWLPGANILLKHRSCCRMSYDVAQLIIEGKVKVWNIIVFDCILTLMLFSILEFMGRGNQTTRPI